MSGRSGYGNGYGYSDAGRYDNDGGYGNHNHLGVNGYSGRAPGSSGGSRDRRPGGYGGFYPEPSHPPALAPGPSPERRRDRSDRDRQQQASHSNSRSRTRNGDDRRYQGSRDDRSREAPRYADGRGRDANGPGPGAMQSNTRERQSVEGLSEVLGLWFRPIILTMTFNCGRGFAIDSAGLGFHERCRVYPRARCPEFDGHKYSGKSRS